MPTIPPEGNGVLDNTLLPSGVAIFPFVRLDGVDEGGITDGNQVYEEVLDVWESDDVWDVEETDTTCEELVPTGAEVDNAAAISLELVGVADGSSVVRMVIVRGPVSVK